MKYLLPFGLSITPKCIWAILNIIHFSLNTIGDGSYGIQPLTDYGLMQIPDSLARGGFIG